MSGTSKDEYLENLKWLKQARERTNREENFCKGVEIPDKVGGLKELIAALKLAVSYVEHAMPQSPGHICGSPDAACDCECMAYAYSSKHLEIIRKVLVWFDKEQESIAD